MRNLPKLPKIKLPKPHMVKPAKAKMPQKVKPKLPGQHTNHPAFQQRAPAGALPPAPKGLPALNTTYDFYIAPNDAPAAPNQSGIKTHLEAEFEMATQHAQNDANFRWTHSRSHAGAWERGWFLKRRQYSSKPGPITEGGLQLGGKVRQIGFGGLHLAGNAWVMQPYFARGGLHLGSSATHHP